MQHHKNFIAGVFHESSSTHKIENRNPSTGELLSTVPDSTDADVDTALDAAKKAQPAWGRRPAIERAGFLRAIAVKLRENVDALAETIALEQGKTLGLAKVEVMFTADYMDYMAEWARRIEGEIIPSDRANENILLFKKPIGVIGGILPWNFPFFLIARKMAPALVCGNTIVIKPSEETPNNAAEFCKLVAETNLPAGVFNVVHGLGRSVGAKLSSSDKIGMITFTGSVETGSRIMQAAAANITKVNLELGGKAPAIVMADANLDMAVKAVKDSRVINSGQVCNCAERVYVQRSVAAEFTEKLTAAMAETKFGDPMKTAEAEYGPLINHAGGDKVERIVRAAVQAGARITTGGKRADIEGGYFYEPTVLADCTQDMKVIHEEIFGPVVPVVAFDELNEAIAFANDSEYGLTSSIYTRDLSSAMHAVKELKFGETYINRENFEAMQGYHAGWRKSGIGGADGKHGLGEFMQTQVVYMNY